VARNIVKLIINKLPKAKASFAQLSKKDVLVGVPSDDDARTSKPGEKSSMNNATIAYIQDNGSPAANIPARPFMVPGIEAVKSQIVSRFKGAAQDVLSLKDNAPERIDKTLNAVGLITQSSIRSVIGQGIPPPLAPSTIASRFRSRGTKTRRKGEEKYLDLIAGGADPADAQSEAGIIALVNTGQLRNSINYVIRDKRSK